MIMTKINLYFYFKKKSLSERGSRLRVGIHTLDSGMLILRIRKLRYTEKPKAFSMKIKKGTHAHIKSKK